MVFKVIALSWFVIGLSFMIFKIYRRRRFNSLIKLNKDVILSNIKTEVKNDSVIEISESELFNLKDSIFSTIKPHIGATETSVLNKQMNLNNINSQLDYINSILNSSGATHSVSFKLKDK
jgi:hypothetical protein